MRQPLVIAVTGHRNLVASEHDGIQQRIRELFTLLGERYPDTPIRLLTPLAEGADQLAAEVALECKVELEVPLPMPAAAYLEDFEDPVAIERFHALCKAAKRIFVLPAGRAGMDRAERYAELGIFLASHCHVLLAVWDGKESAKLGGTSQVVRFHHDDIMPGFPAKAGVSQQMLIDDESDLVYHVVCSREQPDGAPAPGLEALDWWWFTKDEAEPRSKMLPPSHDRILERATDFNRDAANFTGRIEREAASLLTSKGAPLGIHGLSDLDNAFQSADFLAIHYQRKSLRALRVTHVLAFAMGVLFVVYSDIESHPYLLYLFLVCFGAAAMLQRFASRRGWFRKYLDYRTLAEGLRVQFYWAMAGISQSDLEHYSHDNYLQLQDPEVGWIRNAMRVAGITADAMPKKDSGALEVAIEEWVGDAEGGQLGYYAKKSVERTKRQRVTEVLGRLSLVTSAAVVVVLLFVGSNVPDQAVSPLLMLMGVTLLLFAIRHAYAHANAESDLIKQYRFMSRIFSNARKRLDSSLDEAQKREVLIALGKSALDEHAQWIMMHRERSPDHTEIWRMGSGS
jgi:hypothetical protein